MNSVAAWFHQLRGDFFCWVIYFQISRSETKHTFQQLCIRLSISVLFDKSLQLISQIGIGV